MIDKNYVESLHKDRYKKVSIFEGQTIENRYKYMLVYRIRGGYRILVRGGGSGDRFSDDLDIFLYSA